jgi:hypothetical protein
VPSPGETLTGVRPLLLYGKVVEGTPELETAPDMRMRLYQESDAFSGGAWIAGGSSAGVLLVGTKAQGRCWYGFANGVEYPTDPDATAFPEVPPWPNDNRGYWAESYTAMAIFYDPAELGEVAQGKRPPHAVQPYASLDLGSRFLGLAQLPRHRQRDLAGGVAYDRDHQLLFVVQRRADEDRPVVHIWRVGGPSSR